MNATDNPGIWCDDITFCPHNCNDTACSRNKKNIRDHGIPHSFCVGTPPGCPKLGKAEKEETNNGK